VPAVGWWVRFSSRRSSSPVPYAAYNHFSLLRTNEQIFGFGYLGDANLTGVASVGNDVFNRLPNGATATVPNEAGQLLLGGTTGASQTHLVTGAFPMFLNTGVDVGKAVLFFPILEKHSKRTALAYLATMIVEVVLLSVGALALLLIVPVAEHTGDAGAQIVGSTLVQANAMAYQMGELALAVGAFSLCLLLFRSWLVPRWLAVAGLIGYPILGTGCVAEISGVHIGLYLTIPGMFFKIVLPFWLFFKGFRAGAYEL
jgi:hypothetical protein